MSLKSTIQQILSNTVFEKRYKSRVSKYINLSDFIQVNYEEIAGDEPPWFVHALAFRMATYPDEELFNRLDYLISLAKGLKGWENEAKNLGKTWSCNYDELFHFLWMLQCMEYFFDKGNTVEFTDTIKSKCPDLKVTSYNEKPLYVECYVYSKWWFKEDFLEYVLSLIDPNIVIERQRNLRSEEREKAIDYLINDIGNITSPEKLKEARVEAELRSPYPLKEIDGIRVLLCGKGEYPGKTNFHGDPDRSFQVYLKEIVKNKENSNGLDSQRPNKLMVNGLGDDFQKALSKYINTDLGYKSDNIDQVEIYACGINQKVDECSRHVLAKNLNY